MRWLCLLVFCFTACSQTTDTVAASTPAATSTTFRGTSIRLEPFLKGYPYAPLLPIWDKNLFLFDQKGKKGRHLYATALDLDQTHAFESGTRLSKIDWDQRTRWDLQWANDALFFLGDEQNDERINLYRMDVDSGDIKELTKASYVYGYSFSQDKTRVAWISRSGTGPYTSCLNIMNTDGTQSKELICDTPQATFTWDDPSWSPDGSRVVLRVNIQGKRERGNLAVISLEHPQPLMITNPTRDRTSIRAVQHWLDPNRFVFRSDESGFDAVGIYDLSSHETTWLYSTETALSHLEVVSTPTEPLILLTEHGLTQDTLLLINPKDGSRAASLSLNGTISHLGSLHEGQGLIELESAETPFEVLHIRLNPEAITANSWLKMSPKQQTEWIQCDVQHVTFPTFDIDPATQEKRRLHGILYTPRDTVPAIERIVRIKSFYGGANRFSTDTQIFCAAGIATFSPAVRGSWGQGTAFYRLNDGDLGGNEIIDLFEAARWLVSKGYDAKRVGVFGRSHGGYATMRALTFPAAEEGQPEVFPFAFGFADAGFSDILDFYNTSNIPDWVLLEAGDPNTDAVRLKDRSPIHHIDNLKVPLFLSHGANDQRVPVAGSRAMHAACIAAKKPCEYLEFEGQGHAVKGIENQKRLYRARFQFLEQIP